MVPGPPTLGTTAVREPSEHLANIARARRIALPGLLVWSSSFILDAVAAKDLVPGRFLDLALFSVGGLVVIGAALMRMSAKRPPSPRAWRVLMTATFALLNVAFGSMGAIAGGMTSPYYGGALAVLAGFGIVVTLRWRDGLRWAAPVALAYPATLLVWAAFTPSIAAQFADPHARVTLQFDIANLMSLYAVVVAAGHVQWSLRKQIFEARNLGRYKLKTRIGAGGMGEVWVAYHNGLKRDVAVKILKNDGDEDATQAVTRFEREVRATAELTHPNTIRVYDYGVTDDGLCYYVMELLAGENLASLAANEAPLPPARAIHLVAQAARALAEAHTRGIVHRDVKPENILVTNAGGERDFVKVLDFGIAKLTAARDDDETALTHKGSVVGTPKWMAPEAFAGQDVSAAADVYALGAVLYLLLKGVAPMPGETLAEIARAHASGEHAALPSTIPPDLVSIVERCLRPAPAERFANATELAEALAACEDAGRWTPNDARARAERVSKAADAFDVTVALKPLS